MLLSIDNPVYNTIIVFSIIMILLYLIKPDLIYDDTKKEFRQFGTTDGKTLLPIHVIGILLAIILYVFFNNLLNNKSSDKKKNNSTSSSSTHKKLKVTYLPIETDKIPVMSVSNADPNNNNYQYSMYQQQMHLQNLQNQMNQMMMQQQINQQIQRQLMENTINTYSNVPNNTNLPNVSFVNTSKESSVLPNDFNI